MLKSLFGDSIICITLHSRIRLNHCFFTLTDQDTPCKLRNEEHTVFNYLKETIIEEQAMTYFDQIKETEILKDLMDCSCKRAKSLIMQYEL